MRITQEDIDRAQHALDKDEALRRRIDELDEALARKIEEREAEADGEQDEG